MGDNDREQWVVRPSNYTGGMSPAILFEIDRLKKTTGEITGLKFVRALPSMDMRRRFGVRR